MSDKLELEFHVLGVDCLSCVAGAHFVERNLLEEFITLHSKPLCELAYQARIVAPEEFKGRVMQLRLTQVPS